MEFLQKRWESGAPTPAWENRPALKPHLWKFYHRFWGCSRGRQIGMGAGWIPPSEVESYCRLAGIEDPEELELTLYFVQAMDGEWMKNHSEELKRSSKASS